MTIWLVAMGIYYLGAVCLCLVKKLPAAVAFVVFLPAIPFIVAWRSRNEHPVMAKMIVWGWAIFYVLVLLTWLIESHC